MNENELVEWEHKLIIRARETLEEASAEREYSMWYRLAHKIEIQQCIEYRKDMIRHAERQTQAIEHIADSLKRLANKV